MISQTSSPLPIIHARRGRPRKATPGCSRVLAASSANSSTTTPRDRPERRTSSSTSRFARSPRRMENGWVFAAIATL